MPAVEKEPLRPYFAVARLWQVLRGVDAQRGEGTAVEAHAASLLYFALHYIWLFDLLRPRLLGAFLLLFGTWVYWLVILYANSLVVRLCRRARGFSQLKNADAQHLLFTCETIAYAVCLIMRTRFAVFGWAWITLVAFNVLAAFILRLVKPARS